MQPCSILFSTLVVATVALLVNAQNGPLPPRFNIPGAVAAPASVVSRPQFRNDKVVRVRRPVALRAQQPLLPVTPPRIIEEAKPVTEAPEDEDNFQDSFLPQILREQQLAQAQQAQFQQAAAAFLNGDGNSIPDLPSSLLPHEDSPVQVTRLPERERPAPTARPAFNDYGIGAGISGSSSRFGLERPQPNPAPAPVPQRVNVIRTRPAVREPRPQFEPAPQPQPQPRPAPVPVRPRPQPVARPRPSPTLEQNQLQQDEREVQFSQRRQRPVAQTLRKWREENEDGSITWGYENDDGSFKEEIIGTDCITKGTYGYIDPDGNKREYHYETGIKCDPNARETDEELQDNGFINYEENKAVLPNGIEIDMSQLGKRKSKRPNAIYRN